MLSNFFKIAVRKLLRNKSFAAINIIGLAIGMASAIMILLWIQNEVSYDQFHQKKDRIYEVWNQATFNGKTNSWNNTPKVLARAVYNDLPEVEQACRLNWPNTFVFKIDDKKLFVRGNQVDSNFLQVFTFPVKDGNPATALLDVNSIVITEQLSAKLFDKQEAMGKLVTINGQGNFRVTAVLKDLPNNTLFDFEYLLPWSNLRRSGGDNANWSLNSTRTFVLLKPHTTLASVAPKIKGLKLKYDETARKDNWQLFLYLMNRWRLHSVFQDGHETSGGRITMVTLFATIAGFILLIACINFMNLSTANSETRAREVGVRKVAGAQKGSLIRQFIGESILLAAIAGLIAIIIVQLSLPGFNSLVDKRLFIPYFSAMFWAAAIVFVLFTGCLAGSYPAFFLSSFKPVQVLKGNFRKTHAVFSPRKVLVVTQFTFAIVLIICTLVVKQQIDYAKNRQPGYDKNNLVYCYLSDAIDNSYQLLKNDLIRSGAAITVTKTSAPLSQDWNNGPVQHWEGMEENDKTIFNMFAQDGGLGQTAGLHFVTGRDIDLNKYGTDSLGVIINESALQHMRFKEPIGQTIGAAGKQWHVVGVIKDFILASPYKPIKPMLIFGPAADLSIVQIKLNGSNHTSQNLKATEAIFKKYDPEYLFQNNFADQEYAAKFEDEERTGTLAALFAGLTIFVSCLGLLGLAIYMASVRIKEIGVRKVLGASIINIVTLLSIDFVKLVFIATIIASPIAWIAMHKWLESYAYRVGISITVFLVAGILAILITLVTVSFQAIKAAMANPVKSLRTQ